MLGGDRDRLVVARDAQRLSPAEDRRQRLLYVTPKGEALALKLATLQTERIARAFADLGPNAHDSARRFLAAMTDSDNRDGVLRLIARADRARKPQGSMRRFVRSGPRDWQVDEASKQPGRGAYLCSPVCAVAVSKNRRYPGLAAAAAEYGSHQG